MIGGLSNPSPDRFLTAARGAWRALPVLLSLAVAASYTFVTVFLALHRFVFSPRPRAPEALLLSASALALGIPAALIFLALTLRIRHPAHARDLVVRLLPWVHSLVIGALVTGFGVGICWIVAIVIGLGSAWGLSLLAWPLAMLWSLAGGVAMACILRLTSLCLRWLVRPSAA